MPYPLAPADGAYHVEAGVRRRYVAANTTWIIDHPGDDVATGALQAETGAELRGWEYTKFADVAAMNLVTGRPGEICTVTDIGLNFEWSAVDSAWREITTMNHRRFTPGNAPGGPWWVRVLTVDGVNNPTGAGVSALISATGDYGTPSRGTLFVSAGERGGAFTASAWSFGGSNTGSPATVAFGPGATSNAFEIWVRFATFNFQHTLTVLGGTGYTINLDSNTQAAPAGITDVPVADVAMLGRGTTAARPTLGARHQGFMYFDTTVNAPVWWDGTAWVTGAASAPFNGSFTGTGAVTTFTVLHNLALAAPFAPSSIVFVSPTGELLPPGSITVDTLTANSFRVAFSVAPLATETYQVRVVA